MSKDFNEDLSKLLWEFSDKAYENSAGDLKTQLPSGFQPASNTDHEWFLQDENTSTQAIVCSGNPQFEVEENYLVIAFKGSRELTDWFRNFVLSFKVGLNYKNPILRWITALIVYPGWRRAHHGFFGDYKSVRNRIHDIIKRKYTMENVPDKIVITGHSLGGALAILCALDLVENFGSKGAGLITDDSFVMYSYGTPRVGNKAFTKYYDSKITHSFCFVNDEDIVTKLPPNKLPIIPFLTRLHPKLRWLALYLPIGYNHVKNQRYIPDDGNISQIQEYDPITKELEKVDDVKALLTGEAFTDHMRDSYQRVFG
ncbi:MAG: lipase family protein [Candidatus Kariarchaeaceae archaeon]|jgi:hypothetical protein